MTPGFVLAAFAVVIVLCAAVELLERSPRFNAWADRMVDRVLGAPR